VYKILLEVLLIRNTFAVFLDRSIDVPAVVFTFALAIEIALSAVKKVRSEFAGVETTFAKSTLNPGTSFACLFP
jgi:hypothetical protein